MELGYYEITGLLLTISVLLGIKLMSSPKTAVLGNQLGALSMLAAVILVLLYHDLLGRGILWAALALGALIGYILAIKVTMLQMPQLVALFNGLGGGASMLVALVVLFQSHGQLDLFSTGAAQLAVMVGGLTLTGSLVAAGKLHRVLNQRPITLNNHSLLTAGTLIFMTGLALWGILGDRGIAFPVSLAVAALSGFFGILFTIRVGGADMPVTISLLNSLSGLAGAITGLAIADPLLVAVGAIVGAAGLILTQIMCRAMNRSLLEILTGGTVAQAGAKSGLSQTSPPPGEEALNPEPDPAPVAEPKNTPEKQAITHLKNARRVIIVPGYGMALAQAQGEVKKLADTLIASGKDVKFAIHPVAGRMPGHMNVLLAEVDVPYELLYEMDTVNPEFPDTDVVIIVGASDVVNPAAITVPDTPIYGMPVLNVHEAKHVIVCNLDTKPGYSGVENPLYTQENTTLLLGDASKTLPELNEQLRQIDRPEVENAPKQESPEPGEDYVQLLRQAKKVIIVPGYGMALAQAQGEVKKLADTLIASGKEVKFAIHPVAGRMPGHMNVLLAEVDVPYELLYEMDTVNPEFPDTDVVIIVGASDVVNPAAITVPDTPIYGMPVLNVHEAKHVIVCNLDTKPGYSGVENPLYQQKNTTLLLGDASQTVPQLTAAIQ